MADQLATGWGAGEPVDDSVLRRFVFNQAEVIRRFACGPAGRYQRDDDVACADSGGPVPYVNQAVLLRPVHATSDPALDAAERFYADAPGRVSTLLSAWPLPDLSTRGWHVAGHPMFVVRSPGPVTATPRAAVEVRDVTTVDDLRVFERVGIDGYPIPEAKGAPPGATFADGMLGSGLTLRLGAVDGEPVSAAAASTAHGVVNLCFAATLPAGRRRGVWSALVWARVSEAPEYPAVAFTSDDSRPGFVKLGFLPVQRFTLLIRPA
jgi:hypothetical protein